MERPQSVTNWLGTALALMGGVLAIGWALVQYISNNFVSLREHAEFVNRVNGDLFDIKQQQKQFILRSESAANQKVDEIAQKELQRQIDDLKAKNTK